MKFSSFFRSKFYGIRAGRLLGEIAATAVKNEYHVAAVRNGDELRSACNLVYREYLRRGYCNKSDLQLHYHPHMFGTDARTFIIKDNRSLYGTLSVYPDSAAGLPSDELFPAELKKFRDAGFRLAEAGLLATNLDSMTGYSLNSHHKMKVLFSLIKVMMNYLMFRDVSHLVISVHPRHEDLYRFIGFRPFGKVKSYYGACGNPALPMVLRLADFQRRSIMCRWFLENRYGVESFMNQLCETKDAFAALFGESFHTYNERYNHALPPETAPAADITTLVMCRESAFAQIPKR